MTDLYAKGDMGELRFDGDFVTIERTSIRARMTYGKGNKRIPVSTIQAVQWKPAGAVIPGAITFTLAGGVEKQSKFGSQFWDATKDENSVIFYTKQEPGFIEIREAIESAIARRHQPQAPVAAQQTSVAEEIKQLADLRDQGILTDAEFDAEKAKILAR